MTAGTFSIWDCLGKKDEAVHCLAILGPPGSGKSTVLQHLALVLSRNHQRRYEKRAMALTPILLHLRDHANAICVDEPPDVAAVAERHESKKGSKPPDGWFAGELAKRRALVLLDGLDEVAEEDKRRRVVEWVENQIERYPGNRFIVTSRPHGYLATPLKSANVLEVQSFDADRVGRFVHNWYRAHEVGYRGTDDEDVRRSAREKATDLIKRMDDAPSIRAMAVNPLCLTMIALVHRIRGTLPDRRIELYSEIVDVLLGHWQKAKKLEDSYTSAQKRAALEPLALAMMEKGIRSISDAEATAIIRAPLERLGGPMRNDPGTFLRHIQEHSGLLVPDEEGFHGFAHKTFQEYLAAAALLDPAGRGDSTARDESFLIDRLEDEWWRETILLYCAKRDATPFLRECLSRASSATDDSDRCARLFALALKIADERMSADPEVERELMERILGYLESDDDALRRLAAGILLERRLETHFVQIGEAVQLDAAFVTCAEFQLFLDDQGEDTQHLCPLHWEAAKFPPGHATEPVVGILPGAGKRFCEWLSDYVEKKSGKLYRFRFPSYEEAVRSETPTETARPRTGLIQHDDKQELGFWTGDGNDEPYEIHGLTDETLICMNERFRKAQIDHMQKIYLISKKNMPQEWIEEWKAIVTKEDRILLEQIEHKAPFSPGNIPIGCEEIYKNYFGLDLEYALEQATSSSSSYTNRFKYRKRRISMIPYCFSVYPGTKSRIGIFDYLLNKEILDFLVYFCDSNLLFACGHPFLLGKIDPRLFTDIRTTILQCFYAACLFHSGCRFAKHNKLSKIHKIRDIWKNHSRFMMDPYLERAAFFSFLFNRFVLIEERRRGNLPAWEGIRLVREVVPHPLEKAGNQSVE